VGTAWAENQQGEKTNWEPVKPPRGTLKGAADRVPENIKKEEAAEIKKRGNKSNQSKKTG